MKRVTGEIWTNPFNGLEASVFADPNTNLVTCSVVMGGRMLFAEQEAGLDTIDGLRDVLAEKGFGLAAIVDFEPDPATYVI